jgi:DNA-binding response OmpR family regulator
MENYRSNQSTNMSSFGLRNSKPCVCVVERKQHLRTLLRGILEELHFTTSECEHGSELDETLKSRLPDLMILGPSADGEDGFEILRKLAANDFGGRVLILGPRSPILEALQVFGMTLGLAMLSAMPTSFHHERLRERLAILRPKKEPQCPIDLAEARIARTLGPHGEYRQDGSFTAPTNCSR